MKKFDSLGWICNPYQDDSPTDMSSKTSEEFIGLSKDTSLKNNFNRKHLSKFLTISNISETRFLAKVYIEINYRNKLYISHSLRLKVTNVEADADTIMKKNRKQIYPFHWNNIAKKLQF